MTTPQNPSYRISAWVYPLGYPGLDKHRQAIPGMEPNMDAMLRFLSNADSTPEFDSMLRRFQELSFQEPPSLMVVPAPQQLLEKLLWPLRFAKGSYVLENYAGSIALCGMAAEMV